MKEYKTGDIIEGTLTGIVKYGIFVSLDNNYDGLIHISEISPSFVRNINDYVNLNEKIDVEIIDIDRKNKQYKLSIKNIDYRISRPKSRVIQETENGFTTLEKELNGWIEEKLKNSKKSANFIDKTTNN